MKLELDIKGRFFPTDEDPGMQAEVLRTAEAMLRVSYFANRIGGLEVMDLIEAIRAKANELEAKR